MEEKMKKIRNNTGITLITLVVTIIILIILAAITLTMVLGDNGILFYANKGHYEQCIANEKERLELVLLEAMADNKGKVTIENYIEKLIDKGMIDPDSIKDNGDGSKTGITDNGYTATIIDKGDKKIEIIINGTGKAEESLTPSISNLVATPTTKSIDVEVEAKRANNVLYIYSYRETGTEEWIKLEEKKENTCTIQNVKQNQQYDIKVELKHNNKVVDTKEITITTGKIPEGTINIDSIKWNKSTHKASVRIDTTETEYQLQYATEAQGPWQDIVSGGTTEEYALNTTIYARLYDGVNATYASMNIVDNDNPSEAIIEINKDYTEIEDGIIAKVTHIDDQSGVDIEKSKYIFNMTSELLGTTNFEWDYATEFAFISQDLTLYPSVGGRYFIHILTVDNAGNKQETCSEEITVYCAHNWISYNEDEHQCLKCNLIKEHILVKVDSTSEESQQYHICRECGERYEHVWDEMYSDSTHTCKLCESTYDHKWVFSIMNMDASYIPYFNETMEHICEFCKQIVFHNFDSSGYCVDCYYYCTHPICTSEESMGHRCNICGCLDSHGFVGGECSLCGYTCNHEGMMSGEICYFCGENVP